MANDKVYTVETVTFAGTSITDVTDISMSKAQGMQKFFGDGNLYTEFQWLENTLPRATIQTADLTNFSTFSSGDAGVLILEYGKRATGAGGLTAGESVIATWDSSTMLGKLGPAAPQSGPSGMAMNFFGIAADGMTSPIAMSVA